MLIIKRGVFLMDKLFEEQLEKAGKFHGDTCGGIVIGTKIAMYGLEKLGMELNKQNKDLIVFVEIDRCMSDAVQAVTGCSMGKRSLKQMNYGRFAATFYNMSTGEAFRITDVDANSKKKLDETKEEMIERFKNTPPKELFNTQRVEIKLDENELPGKPIIKAFCSICHEKVMDSKHKLIGGKPVCKSCSEESYYRII
jgi:formylmethanofuran dehydrogenase subunit E